MILERRWRTIRVDLAIEDGLHLQANPAGAEYLVPTSLTASGLELRNLEYPEGQDLVAEFSGERIRVYSGAISIRAQVLGEGTLQVTYQACRTNGCLPPVRVDLRADGTGSSAG